MDHSEKFTVVWNLLLTPDVKPTKLLEEFLQAAISCTFNKFPQFLESVGEGVFFQIYEGYFLHLPESLIEDFSYTGDVMICVERWDGKEYVERVKLDEFCFYVKLSAVFYATHVDTNFNPWPYFRKIDAMMENYLPHTCVEA